MRGFTFLELLVTLFLVAASLVVALPSLAYIREEGRAGAGARQVASTLQALRFKSVARRKALGLYFERRGDAWIWLEVEDGNGNDLRTAEVRSGVDPTRSGPHASIAVGSARLGFPPV
jgi:prepilin-type N-terminal cleavage/methylation domain-containing protein